MSKTNSNENNTPASSRPVSAVSTASAAEDNTPFGKAFRAFAKFGDSKNSGDAITLSNSDKWFKQAKVIDKKITTTDTGIYWKQIAKTKKTLNQKEYLQFLDKVAVNKKIELEEIKKKLEQCSSPASNTKASSATIDGVVSRLTDPKKYTGSHKLRFDQNTGKGLGKAGRTDEVKNLGYVTGFKSLEIKS